MSYDDPNRNEAGQFHYLGLPGATTWEQEAAGVNRYDDALSASMRVRNRRAMLGLDEFTGEPLPTTTGASGGYSGGYARAPADGAGVGSILWTLFKWVALWPLALLCLAGMALVALAWAEREWRDSGRERGVAALALKSVAGGAALAPASTYLTPKEIANAKRLDDLLRSSGSGRPAQRDLASSYLCQIDARCARDAEARSGMFVGVKAVLFLQAEARKGGPRGERAARDACLLPVLSGSRLQPLLLSMSVCRDLALAGSAEARALTAAWSDSGWAQLGRALELAADMACFDVPSAFCGLSDVPTKLSRAASLYLAPR